MAETVPAGHAILALTAAIKQPGEACAIAFLQTDNPGQSSDALTRRKSASCNQLPTRLVAVPQRSAFRQFTQIIWAFQKDGTSDIGFWPRIRGRATIDRL